MGGLCMGQEEVGEMNNRSHPDLCKSVFLDELRPGEPKCIAQETLGDLQIVEVRGQVFGIVHPEGTLVFVRSAPSSGESSVLVSADGETPSSLIISNDQVGDA